MKQNLVNLLVVVLLYFNLSALLPASGIRLPPYGRGVAGPLPNHWMTQNLFRLFGVFGSTSKYCYGFGALGTRSRLAEAPEEPLPEMLALDVYEYFPQSRGEAHQRLALWGYRGDRDLRRRAYRRMAETIQRLHNRSHPESPLAQVFLYQYHWPKSRTAFAANASRRAARLLGHS